MEWMRDGSLKIPSRCFRQNSKLLDYFVGKFAEM